MFQQLQKNLKHHGKLRIFDLKYLFTPDKPVRVLVERQETKC